MSISNRDTDMPGHAETPAVTQMQYGAAFLVWCRRCTWRHWDASHEKAAHQADLHDGDHYGDDPPVIDGTPDA